MRILLRTLVVICCLPLVWFFAPVQLHGHTGYVIVSGISMEPHFHGGDLVLLHEKAHYRVGDIAAYRDRSRGIVVMHRIVRISGDGALTFRGDNNDLNDLHPVKAQDLVGGEWISIPRVGTAMLWIRKPVHAILFAVAALLLTGVAGGIPRRSTRGSGPETPEAPRRRTPRRVPASTLQLLVANAFALAGGVFLMALAAPTTRSDVDTKLFGERTAFGLTGHVPPGTPVYENGRVDGANAIFTRLVHKLRVEVDYAVTSHMPLRTSGTLRLDLDMASTNGWHDVKHLASVPIHGSRTTLSAPLDLRKVAAIAHEVDVETGVPSSQHRMTLVAHVAMRGFAGATPIASTLAPSVTYSVEPNRLLLQPGPSGNPFSVAKTAAGLVAVSNSFHLGIANVSIRTARGAAAWACAILFVALLATLLISRPWTDEATRLAWRYGEWLVPIKQLPRTSSTVTDVTDFDALVRIADSHNKSILHLEADDAHTYLVKENGLLYRYTAGEARAAVAAAHLPHPN